MSPAPELMPYPNKLHVGDLDKLTPHGRLWNEWYAAWHDADASKPKPSYEGWLEKRLEAAERWLRNYRTLAEERRAALAGEEKP